MKIGKWVLIALGVVLLLGIVAYFFIDEIAQGYAKESLEEIISNDPDPLYDYSYGKLHLSITKGDLSIRDIKITPRKAALDGLHEGRIKVLIESEISEIRIEGVDLMELLNTGHLEINRIMANRPDVVYHVNPEVKKVGNSLVLNDLLSDDLVSAELESLKVNNARIEFNNIKKTTPTLSMDSVFLEFDSIYVDSVTLTQPFAFEFGEVLFKAHHLDQELSELYRLKAGEVDFDYRKNILTIHKPQLAPTRDRFTYGELTKTETDLFSLTGESIEIDGFITGTFVEHGLLTVPVVRLNGIDLKIFRDKHLPDPPFKKKPMPVSAIKMLELPIKVDSVVLNNCKVASTQLDTLNDKAGTVFFHALNGSITNVTNDSLSILENNEMLVDADALIFGRGMLQTQMRFFLDSPYDQFEVSAQLGRMDATVISPVLDSMLLVKISSGRIHSLSMDMHGNDDRAVGTMEFIYQDLKLDILKLHDQNKSNWFMNFVANTVVKSSNLKSQKNYKHGAFEIQRRKDRAIFNYLWNATKFGLMDISTPISGSQKKKGDRNKKTKSGKK